MMKDTDGTSIIVDNFMVLQEQIYRMSIRAMG